MSHKPAEFDKYDRPTIHHFLAQRKEAIREMMEVAAEDHEYAKQIEAQNAHDKATQEYYANEEQLTGLEEHLRDCQPSTTAELDRDDANLAGRSRTKQAWILSDRDVWYRNPYYIGPKVAHPEEA
jgi:hypothetical protein